MTEDEALMAAIRADPADDTPRLIYADWLQENGREPRAELIRAGIRAHKRDPAFVFAPGMGYEEISKFDADKKQIHFLTQHLYADLQQSCGSYYVNTACHYIGVTRGFVSHLTLPLTVLCGDGGKCGNCQGRGKVWTGRFADRGENEYSCAQCGRASGMYGHQGRCPSESCTECDGTGDAQGLAKYIFAQPIQYVEITDRQPRNPGNGWTWFSSGALGWRGYGFDEYLPEPVFRHLTVGSKAQRGCAVYWGTNSDWEARELAHQDLRAACLAYGRQEFAKTRREKT